MSYPVFMDCDTGTDDAVAILLAHALPEIELVGISSVCGNAEQEDTFRNNWRINGLMGTHYPIYRGAEKPLMNPLRTAPEYHGQNGLGDVDLPLPQDAMLETEKAWDALYREARAHSGELRVIATGPLTNVALALMKYPDLSSMLHTILLMGGSACGGNITPAAEFNFYEDPQAADCVMRSGVPVVMCGLDVTTQIYLTPEDLDAFAASGNRIGCFVHDSMQKYLAQVLQLNLPGVSMNDACPVMYLAHPEYFEGQEAGVVVETRSSICNGMTVTDLYSDKQFSFRNAFVVLKADSDRFISLLKSSILSI